MYRLSRSGRPSTSLLASFTSSASHSMLSSRPVRSNPGLNPRTTKMTCRRRLAPRSTSRARRSTRPGVTARRWGTLQAEFHSARPVWRWCSALVNSQELCIPTGRRVSRNNEGRPQQRPVELPLSVLESSRRQYRHLYSQKSCPPPGSNWSSRQCLKKWGLLVYEVGVKSTGGV